MEIRSYLRPLVKWWWLLLLATAVAAIASYAVVQRQPAIYEARTTLMIGRVLYDPNPSGNQFVLGQQLASAYADIAQRQPVRSATASALGLGGLPNYVARALPNSQLMEIVVTDTNPQRAQAVANELANQLILQSPTDSRQADQDRAGFVGEQLDYLESKIQETQDDIAEKQLELAEMVSARQIADTQIAITALQDKLTSLQTNYASLLSSTQRGAVNTLSVIESATLPQFPVGPNVNLIVFLAATIGFVLASGGAYLIEYLDDTLRTPEEISRAFGLPILGYIANFKSQGAGLDGNLFVGDQPYSPVSEAFRSLQTNLELEWGEIIPRTILVTSPKSRDGKTTIAANLAATMAQGRRRVMLIDADFRRPALHELLDIDDSPGLSDAIAENLTFGSVGSTVSDERLRVVPSGGKIERPTEVLNSLQMVRTLSRLLGDCDLAIFDSSPFVVTDPLILASKLHGVLIVIRLGSTRKGEAEAMLEQLRRAQARLLGVVINRAPRGMGAIAAGYESRRELQSERQTRRGSPNGEGELEPLAEEQAPPFIDEALEEELVE